MPWTIIGALHFTERPGSANLFDEKDRRILELLQEDADRPIAEIAQAVSLSTSPCWRRIQRMQEDGLIARRVVLLDREKAGLPMTVFVAIRAQRHALDWLAAFRAALQDIPEIVEAYRLTGEIDYLLRLVVPSIQAYDRVYKELIGRLELADVSSSISMEELKFTTAIPTRYVR